MITNKNLYFQQLRGFCIILVVLIHLPIGLDTDDSSFLWLSIRQFINFPVATFIFLSAYFCKYDCNKNILIFYEKRLKRLLVPYLIWACFYLIIYPLIKKHTLDDDALFLFLTGYGPAYFLLVLIQLTIITPLIFKYKDNQYFRIFSWVVTPVYILFCYAYLLKTGKTLPAYQTPFPAWYIFYFFAITYKQKLDNLKSNINTLTLIFTIIVFLVFANFEGQIILKYVGDRSFAISQIKLSSIIYSLLMIVLFMYLQDQPQKNCLSYIGDYSMGIFMLHPFFNWVFKFIVIHLRMFDYNSFPGLAINHIIVLICSISCSLISAYLVGRYFPRTAIFIGLK